MWIEWMRMFLVEVTAENLQAPTRSQSLTLLVDTGATYTTLTPFNGSMARANQSTLKPDPKFPQISGLHSGKSETASALEGGHNPGSGPRRSGFFLDLRRSHGPKWDSLSSLPGERHAMNLEEKIQSIPENERLAAAIYALNTVLIARGIVTREELEEGLDSWLRRKELLREKATVSSQA
jgi:hypothetical protein